MTARPGDEIKPSRYRKLPVEISAIRWSGHNLREVIDFTGLHSSAEKWTWEEYEEVVRTQGLKLFTLEKSMMASIGDYIIKGVAGEVYACKPDIFWKTYERASSARPEAQGSDAKDKGDSSRETTIGLNGAQQAESPPTWIVVEKAKADAYEDAARLVEKLAEDYTHEHGSYDDSTNAWELGSRHMERIEGLDDAVAAIRKRKAEKCHVTQAAPSTPQKEGRC